MLKQVLKGDNALLGQMFMEASLNCGEWENACGYFFSLAS